jgi:hypothetical protein
MKLLAVIAFTFSIAAVQAQDCLALVKGFPACPVSYDIIEVVNCLAKYLFRKVGSMPLLRANSDVGRQEDHQT